MSCEQGKSYKKFGYPDQTEQSDDATACLSWNLSMSDLLKTLLWIKTQDVDDYLQDKQTAVQVVCLEDSHYKQKNQKIRSSGTRMIKRMGSRKIVKLTRAVVNGMTTNPPQSA